MTAFARPCSFLIFFFTHPPRIYWATAGCGPAFFKQQQNVCFLLLNKKKYLPVDANF
eukprot:NODE_1064_length_617_cov_19.639085_g992_i0.p3 GENE.NODE_1064_length_617_cov_19.639085_g992_i0~~NODE_1064_length_617_cov_19.639085_g992_i0.p3  ORF type:complete len:57 (+),score=9.52 NODE_1064_length_617_cov_19.639085_g992_i0:85-255(+)